MPRFLIQPGVKKSSPASCRRGRGFTIAEVMVAAGVMALAITTAITTMQSAFLALDSARKITLAGQIMQGELEKMRLKNWDTIVTHQQQYQPETITIDPAFANNPAIGNRFTLQRTIEDINADMKEITLRIAWRGYDGRVHTRYYRTYYGRNGLHDYFYNSY